MADVVTGEAVALELPVATFLSRIAALLIDMAVQAVLLIIAVLWFAGASSSVSNDYGAAAFVLTVVVVLVGYPTVLETVTRGKTLGKMAFGIRVVGDDGSPVRFRQALVRALVGVFEVWTFVLAPVGLVASIISARGKRVGDFFAGTYVIQERTPPRRPLPQEFAVVPAPLAEWARLLQVSSLSDQTADAAGSYLRRFAELTPQARESLGVHLASAVAAQVSPPPPAGTPPAAYLSAVLAVRRERERERLAAAQFGQSPTAAAASFSGALPPPSSSAPPAAPPSPPPPPAATSPDATAPVATPPEVKLPRVKPSGFVPPA